ncbi:MAG: ATP-binding cassette domain-containing protein [Desulfobacteraceae bacterium]|nr:MAG: ATP-binding cassette domain-containing protein [Desulfobacteraceae bacterium]
MSLVSCLGLSLSFLGKTLFHELHLQIEPGERLGLIGPNGSGKTSLLRLLVGEVSPDKGEIRITKGTRVGYLPQDIYESLGGTLLQSVLDSIPSRNSHKLEIKSLEQSLKNAPDAQKANIGVRLAELHEKLNDLETQFPAHKAEKILTGLGFKQHEMSMPISNLSGGWKMRAALASILYQEPDLLLLDEPTNHLDFFSVRWLEEFLRGFKGAMVIICHDRDFLNRQINRTMGFETEGPRIYSGNVDSYLSAREEENKVLDAKARNQEQKVKEAMKFVERFRAKASKARQAQSKIKLVEKLALIETHKREKNIRFSFPPVSRSGRDVLTLSGVSKSFGEKHLYEKVLLRAMRGERIAIIGPNGAGKTTLLRMVAGELMPDEGEIVMGHGVAMSYYAQHLSEMLDPRKSILEEVYQVVPHQTISFVRGICGAFLFSGSDVDKPVGVLSGGERARVSLAKILVKPGNFIVMDEPTNHLDIMASERLIDALAEFDGTLVFVSHNLSFVRRLATRIWDIRDGAILDYPGTLKEYQDHLELRTSEGEKRQEELKPAAKPSQTPRQEPDRKKELRKEKAERRSLVSATLKPIQEKLQKLEDRIHAIEERMKEVERLLSDPETFKDKEKCVPLLNEYTELKKKLEELMGRWEYNQEELETAKQGLGVEQG